MCYQTAVPCLREIFPIVPNRIDRGSEVGRERSMAFDRSSAQSIGRIERLVVG